MNKNGEKMADMKNLIYESKPKKYRSRVVMPGFIMFPVSSINNPFEC